MKAAVDTAYKDLTVPELFTEYRRTGDDALKWEIVLRNAEMVKCIASQTRGIYSSFAELDDIISEGLLVLADAVDKYDPERGSFSNYVSKRIRGMIIDLARSNNWGPRLTIQRKKEIDQAISTLHMTLNRHPTDHEVAEYLGITDETYRKRIEQYAFQNMLSWEELFADPSHCVGTAEDFVSPEQSVEDLDMLNTLAEAIKSLRQKQQIVLSLYYKEGLTMEEVASVMGITRSRVCQIHKAAIAKLRGLIGGDPEGGGPYCSKAFII